MAEYIEREAAIAVIHKWLSDIFGIDEVECTVLNKRLNVIPAADVVLVRHGRWIDMGDFISCSECNVTRMKEFLCDYGVSRRLDVRTNYCPNCGARMDKDGDGDV